MTDNGPSFTSNEFKLFNVKIEIKHIFTAPYFPLSNGVAELSVQTFKNDKKGKQCRNLNATIFPIKGVDVRY